MGKTFLQQYILFHQCIIVVIAVCKTVRVSSCELLVKGNKSASRVSYRDSLHKTYHRYEKQKSVSPGKKKSTTNRTNFRWLKTSEHLKEKISVFF